MNAFSLSSYLGVIGAWFRAFGDPDHDPDIRGEPQTPHSSPPQTSRTPQFPSNLIKATQTLSPQTQTPAPQFPSNLVKVKATQTLTPVRGVTDTTLFKPKFLVGGGGGGYIKRAATLPVLEELVLCRIRFRSHLTLQNPKLALNFLVEAPPLHSRSSLRW